MERFDPSRPDAFPHGGTFNNNVLAMAAGHAALTQVLTAEAVDRMNARGDRLRDGVNQRARERDLPFQATGIGSIFGLHFHRGPIHSVRDLEAGEHGRETEIAALKKLFQFDMLARGLYVTRRITGNLSLASSEEDVTAFLDGVSEFLDDRGTLIRQVIPG
jgi:glutamate-1-semialdehyde 2,1-aminomutase